ncbi:unnamed protein product [Soboliphyme baturini]|uniref:T-complex protein 1 subunit delta n=1 Tax=Soboliphyme baturini TaxID=241478 RepID=A0A183IVF0_9BILA|nr:unnamed protein product [Soboliphyme baturini]
MQHLVVWDAVTDLALHFLAKLKILTVKDIEREDINFLTTILGCRPIASLDHFVPEALGSADLVQEISTDGSGKVVKFTGVQNSGKAVSVLLRGSNRQVLDESERSLHDALCVIRCLVKKRFMVCGGGAPEMEVAYRLREMANAIPGVESYCWRAFADALEIIPYTLAENAGLNPIVTVTELRNMHASGEKTAGINVRKGRVTNMVNENVLQPLLVSTSIISLATETVNAVRN